jgi:hypothetical protein
MGKLQTRFSTSVGLQFGLALSVAVVFLIAAWFSGKAGDCKPQEVDGQCGLSTFAGLLFGVIGAVVIVLVSSIAIGIAAWRRDRRTDY